MTYYCNQWNNRRTAAEMLNGYTGINIQDLYSNWNQCSFYDTATIYIDDEGIPGTHDLNLDGNVQCDDHGDDAHWEEGDGFWIAIIDTLPNDAIYCTECRDADAIETPIFLTTEALDAHMLDEHPEIVENAEAPTTPAPEQPGGTGCATYHPALTTNHRHRIEIARADAGAVNATGWLIYQPDNGQAHRAFLSCGQSQPTTGNLRRWRQDWPSYFYISATDPHIFNPGRTSHTGWR